MTEYARLLLAETDSLALAGVDVDMDANTGNKRARVAQLEAKGTPKGGAPKGQQDKGGKAQEGQWATKEKPEKTGKGSPGDAGKGTDSKQPCKFFLTKNGCRHGKSCWSLHDHAKAVEERRCFVCGAEGHQATACNRPQGPGGKGPGKKTGKTIPRDEPGSATSAATTANAQSQSAASPAAQAGPEANRQGEGSGTPRNGNEPKGVENPTSR